MRSTAVGAEDRMSYLHSASPRLVWQCLRLCLHVMRSYTSHTDKMRIVMLADVKRDSTSHTVKHMTFVSKLDAVHKTPSPRESKVGDQKIAL